MSCLLFIYMKQIKLQKFKLTTFIKNMLIRYKKTSKIPTLFIFSFYPLLIEKFIKISLRTEK